MPPLLAQHDDNWILVVIDPNDQHADCLASGYESVAHARAAARERREAAREDDETYMQELLDDSCFGVPKSFEDQQG